MNKLVKYAVWLFGIIMVLLGTLSCEEDYYAHIERGRYICRVPKFYKEKQGFYEGKMSLIQPESSAGTFICPIEFCGYYDTAQITIHNFPITNILEFAKNNLGLAEKLDNYQLSEIVSNSKRDFCFDYYLYGYLELLIGKNGRISSGSTEIDSTFQGNLFFQIPNGFLKDSIYNEDKSQKLKYQLYAKTNEDKIITLYLTGLEFNEVRLLPDTYDESHIFARIKVGDEKIAGNVP